MITKLSTVEVLVNNQDEAKKFYVEKLGFVVRMDDADTVPGFRWLTVAPIQRTEVDFVLNLPTNDEQKARVGKQTTWVLASDNIEADYQRLKAGGIKVHNEPRVNPWGTDFVFEDLYGNTYDLVQFPSR